MKILFVGISNKSTLSGDLKPLDETTATGKIISQIEQRIMKNSVKINLVDFTPLDDLGKIRYPNDFEIQNNMPKLIEFIKSHAPCLVFLLGKLVEKSFFKYSEMKKIKDCCYFLDIHIILYSIKHPSYIHTYKKDLTGEYINEIEAIVKKHI